MKMEILADKTLDWFERLMNSPWCDRICLCVLALAAWQLGRMLLHVINK